MRWPWIAATALVVPLSACGDDPTPADDETEVGSGTTTTSTTAGPGTSGDSGPVVTCSVSETMIERIDNDTESVPLLVVGEAMGNVEEFVATLRIDDGPVSTFEGGAPVKESTRSATSPFHYEYPLQCFGTGQGELQVLVTASSASASAGVADAVETKVIPYVCLADDGGSSGTGGGSTGTGGGSTRTGTTTDG